MRRLVHTAWQTLPCSLRRTVYERLTGWAALPANTPAPESRGWEPPFVVAGPLSAPTGLGASARLLLDGLRDLGEPVSAIDLTRMLRQPEAVPVPDLPPAPLGAGTMILAVQPPSVAHAVAALGRRRLAGKRRIGYWMWELETLPRAWVASRDLVHDIAAPSRFAAAALARGLSRPVHLLSFPLAPIPRPKRSTSGPLVFGAGFDLGSTAARKNPFGVVEAFRRAFGGRDDVRLLLKVRGEEADPDTFRRLLGFGASAEPPVELVVGSLDASELARWWDRIDVLVSLHRSEGFGLFPAEAMLRGIPVVATDWSATTDFVTAETGWPVAMHLTPTIDPTGRYQLPGACWAEPDLDAAAAALRDAHAIGRAGLIRRGQRAAELMATQFSIDRFADQLRRREAYVVRHH